MISLGPIGFLSPWLLGALIALPIIWWLLRLTPPGPERRPFPPTRILLGIERDEEDRAHSPWWLTLIRLLAAAAVIFALARPVINPQTRQVASADLYVLLIDNGWSAAGDWAARQATASQLIEQLEVTSRPLLLLTTADADEQATSSPVSARKALEQLAGFQPRPWAPDRALALRHLRRTLAAQKNIEIFYVADGLDYGGGAKFLTGLGELAAGPGRLTLFIGKDATQGPLALAAVDESELVARVISPGGIRREGRVLALDGKERVLAAQQFVLSPQSTSAELRLDLPLELRNEITRLEIEHTSTAGGVFLLDDAASRSRVGLISGETVEQAQPLLSSLYYLRKALAPHAEIANVNDRNTASAVDSLLQQKSTTLVLAGIGQVGGETTARLEDWLNRGGMLIRFAGPRLKQGVDDLLPVPLRQGERALGGALSWSQPQQLAPFEEGSPFFGLAVPKDVTVSRQVLADPAALDNNVEIWARLTDGTPLVTARRGGRGYVVLFHVTANSDWSNLPHSGLFVDMLRRVIALSNGVAEPSVSLASEGEAAGGEAAGENGMEGRADAAGVPTLPPLRLLDGFGRLAAPSPRAEPIRLADLGEFTPSPRHPPGLYGNAEMTRAANIGSAIMALTPLTVPTDVRTEAISATPSRPLAPALLALALMLFLADGAIFALMKGLTNASGPQRLPTDRLHRMVKPLGFMVLGAALLAALAPSARAETRSSARGLSGTEAAAERFALDMTLDTRLAYVRTGDPAIDRTSRLGLAALTRQLARRTAFEPEEPVGIDIASDELAFFPVLYWPVQDSPAELDEKTIARVNAYMKQGGLILFDTRDEISSFLHDQATGGATPLSRLIGRLDIPPLEQVTADHVLTRSFYLLEGFPGRWNSGHMWAEAGSQTAGEDPTAARSADGVSSILITSNDLAAAWATDEAERPLHALAPDGEAQREMAYRGGINIVMYALTGNYKADQVHLPALMRRLGQ